MYDNPSGLVLGVLIVGGGILTLLTVIVLGVFLGGDPRQQYNRPFDQQLWLATSQLLRSDKVDIGIPGTENPRERMVDHVMTYYLHVGMSRAQVLFLLGLAERDGIQWVVPDDVPLPDSLNDELMSTEAFLKQNPESFNKWHRQNAQPDTLMVYRVGWRYLDPIFMRIEFNGHGRVRKVWIH